jgi:hypothetical protein
MNKERDLLPWIIGSLSVAAIAVAFAAVSTHRTTPSSPSQAVAAQPPASPAALTPALPTALPEATIAPAPSPAVAPDPLSNSAPPPPRVQNTVAPEMPGGQIWECETKGVKTFSNNPCGEKSTQLDVGPINTMIATPAVHFARAYGSEPRYAQGYADQSAPADEQYSDDYGAEAGGNSYTLVQGAGFAAHRRPEHSHRPPPHHIPGHAAAPVRRY